MKLETLIRTYERKIDQTDTQLTRKDGQITKLRAAIPRVPESSLTELAKERSLLVTQRKTYEMFVSDLYSVL